MGLWHEEVEEGRVVHMGLWHEKVEEGKSVLWVKLSRFILLASQLLWRRVQQLHAHMHAFV